MTSLGKIHGHLLAVYDSEQAQLVLDPLKAKLKQFQEQHPEFSQLDSNTYRPVPTERVTQKDSILITYGDQVNEPGQSSLETLGEFLSKYLQGIISSVHLLPFYPYTSDDGFSVVDYKAVDEKLGNWSDIKQFRNSFRLMFDAVINHVSSQNIWFQNFLQGHPKYEKYFITEKPTTDLSKVTRPRTHALLTPFETSEGIRHVWTTFSEDQIDLNYAQPEVLLEIIDVLLFYVAQGADFIRLDAIGFMWKEIGTSCIHLPQTHRVIQLFRSILDVVAPHVLLITETNVPHEENISYFGDGTNEAQMVYQFSLAPLILHTFRTGDASVLSEWASSLRPISETVSYFNFIASHDGIGVRPAEGILTSEEIDALAQQTFEHGGDVSYKTNANGSQSPYELNITLFDALSNPQGGEPESFKIERFIASQAIMLALRGVPGVYIHSLFGSSSNHSGVEQTGRARTINRQKWTRCDLEALLDDPLSRSSQVFQRYVHLLKVRSAYACFHPNSNQQILTSHAHVFALLRTTQDKQQQMLCVHNISSNIQTYVLPIESGTLSSSWIEVFSEQELTEQNKELRVQLGPYEVGWFLAQ